MEFKVLNTLWTKQVTKWPDRSLWFTFSIGSTADEYARYREAAYKLLGEGLVKETDKGMFHLTPKGFDYCREHYPEFPKDQWWPEEEMSAENLAKVLTDGARVLTESGDRQ